LRRILRRELEIEVLGLHLTVKRIILLAVLVCLLVLMAYMVTEFVSNRDGGPDHNLTELNNTTGRYEEDDTNLALCFVFIFLALVLMYFIVAEVRT
jgi:hypothetical protein